jgi:GPI ethanolamine phosphate transferase 3 subunit O
MHTEEIASIDTCVSHKRFDKLVLLIIDALRLDFIVSSTKSPSMHENFPYVHEILHNNASHAMLYGFRADPPTTTSQRLKALTTGSLPTFLDFGSNFNQDLNVRDDNIIDQFISNRKDVRKRSIFLGDDTWMALYPNRFNLSHASDSFNTKDLYTVDNHIEKYLLPLLTENDYDLFIAHFLGVDHVGHTHNAFHPLMKERLQRMDELIKETIEILDEGSLLVVFGDHGMSDDGNHGGASEEEVNSAIFFYSKQAINSVTEDGLVPSWDEQAKKFGYRSVEDLATNPRMISQVDLVPTISLLLGNPIPYSNLGHIIPELFLEIGDGDQAALKQALNINAAQVDLLHTIEG